MDCTCPHVHFSRTKQARTTAPSCPSLNLQSVLNGQPNCISKKWPWRTMACEVTFFDTLKHKILDISERSNFHLALKKECRDHPLDKASAFLCADLQDGETLRCCVLANVKLDGKCGRENMGYDINWYNSIMRTKHPDHRNPSDDKLKKKHQDIYATSPKKPLEIPDSQSRQLLKRFIKFRLALAWSFFTELKELSKNWHDFFWKAPFYSPVRPCPRKIGPGNKSSLKTFGNLT